MCCGSWTQPSCFIVAVKGSDWLMFDICWQVPGSLWTSSPLRTNMASERKTVTVELIWFIISSSPLPPEYAFTFLQPLREFSIFSFRRSIMRQIEMDFKIIKIFSIQLWGTSVFGQRLVRIWAWLLRRVRKNERRLPSSIRLLTAKHWSDYGTYQYGFTGKSRRMDETCLVRERERERDRETGRRVCAPVCEKGRKEWIERWGEKMNGWREQGGRGVGVETRTDGLDGEWGRHTCSDGDSRRIWPIFQMNA